LGDHPFTTRTAANKSIMRIVPSGNLNAAG